MTYPLPSGQVLKPPSRTIFFHCATMSQKPSFHACRTVNNNHLKFQLNRNLGNIFLLGLNLRKKKIAMFTKKILIIAGRKI